MRKLSAAEHIAFFEQKLSEIDEQIVECKLQRSTLRSTQRLSMIRLKLANAIPEAATEEHHSDITQRVREVSPKLDALDLDLQRLENRRAYVIRQLDSANTRTLR